MIEARSDAVKSIGTWNVRSKNQGKLEIVKQEMARVNVDILGISELKWTGTGEFNSDAYIFPFLLCFLPLFFSQLFVRPPQQTFCFFAFLFHEDGLDPCLLHKVKNLIP